MDKVGVLCEAWRRQRGAYSSDESEWLFEGLRLPDSPEQPRLAHQPPEGALSPEARTVQPTSPPPADGVGSSPLISLSLSCPFCKLEITRWLPSSRT